jgi:hypothetical protein
MSQYDTVEEKFPLHLSRMNITTLGIGVGLTMTILSCFGIVWQIGKFTVLMSIVLTLVVLFLTRSVFKEFEINVSWSWFFFLTPLLIIPIIVSFSHPYTWDEVAYGIALPRDYARAGSFYYNADYGPYSAFPGNYEALTTASLLLFNSVTPVKLLNIVFAISLGIAALQIYKLLGFDGRFAPIAGAAVVCANALALLPVVVKNDLSNAFFQSLAILAFVAYTKDRKFKFLLLSGAFLGIALGIKYSSLQFAACMLICVALTLLRMPLNRISLGRHFIGFILAIGLLSSPWYLRNLLFFSNPFFPFFNDVLHAHNGFGQEHVAIAKEMFNGITGFSFQQGKLHDFFRVTLHQFGYFPMLLSIPGLMLAPTRRISSGLRFVSMLFISYTLVTIFWGYWSPRYFAVLLDLSSVFGTICISVLTNLIVRLCRINQPWSKHWIVVGAVVLSVALLARHSLLVQRSNLGAIAKSVLRGESVDTFGARYVSFWDLAQWINRHLEDSDKIGVGINVQPFYYVDKKYFNIHPMSEKGDLQGANTEDDFMKAFKSLDLTMLAIYEWRPNLEYPIDVNPHMYNFMKRFYSAIASLEATQKIVAVAHIGDVTVFKIN